MLKRFESGEPQVVLSLEIEEGLDKAINTLSSVQYAYCNGMTLENATRVGIQVRGAIGKLVSIRFPRNRE